MRRFKTYFTDVEWFVAIRPHEEAPLEKQTMSFTVLNNTFRYWCADPFPMDRDGKTYVFMEVYDRFLQQGFIGYRTIERGRVSPIQICLKGSHHLSYPFLFEQDGVVYMLPECYQSGELTLYRAVDFPNKWEKAAVLLSGLPLCDTNAVVHDGTKYLLTTKIHGTPFVYDELSLYRFADGAWHPACAGPVVQGAEHARNGGGVFFNGGRMIRPAQNCAGTYGDSLVFRQILSFEDYREQDLLPLSASDIRVGNSRRVCDGVHTFNAGVSYDVIDLRVERTFQPAKFASLVKHKLYSLIGR